MTRCLLACLVITLCAFADTREILARVDEEAERFRRAGETATAEHWSARAAQLRRRLGTAKGMAKDPTPVACVVAVTPGRRLGRRGPSVVDITLACPGRPVQLVLVAPHRLRWRVRASAVELDGVWTVGDRRHQVDGVPARKIRRIDAPPFYGRRDPEYPAARARIEAHLGGPIATVQERYRPDDVIRVGPADAHWQAQQIESEARALLWEVRREHRVRMRHELRHVRFEAVYQFGRDGVAFGEFGVGGPHLARQRTLPRQMFRVSQCVRHPSRALLFCVLGRDLVRYDGRTRVLEPDERWPSLEGARGLGVHAKRGRLLVAGRKYLYAVDLETFAWSVVNDLNEVDVAALAWDAARDRVYAVERDPDATLRLHVFDAKGAWLREQATAARSRRPLQAVCVDDKLVLVETSRGPTLLFVVDPRDGTVRLRTPQRFHATGAPVDASTCERAWNELLGTKVPWAQQRLLDGGVTTVAFLRRKMLGKKAPLDVVARLGDLGAADAGRREATRVLLQRRADLSGLEAALGVAKDPDVRLALRMLIERARKADAERDQREVRAVQVLGWMDTPAALQLLKDLARDQSRPVRANAARRMVRRNRAPR